jgi:hypothetical protein
MLNGKAYEGLCPSKPSNHRVKLSNRDLSIIYGGGVGIWCLLLMAKSAIGKIGVLLRFMGCAK